MINIVVLSYISTYTINELLLGVMIKFCALLKLLISSMTAPHLYVE